MTERTVRVAAVGDLHMRPAVRGLFRPAFEGLGGRADLLLLAGDLTNGGTPEEAKLLIEEVANLPVPVVAVLGNHDHDEGYGRQLASALEESGVRVLDGDGLTVDIDATRVGIAGVMGGGGGFPETGLPTSVNDGNPEHEARLKRGADDAKVLRSVLGSLDCDVRLALMHFAPVLDTLVGEPVEIYPGLGCYLLAEAVDAGGAQLAIHGHAHSGSECGQTAGGTPVRNVSYPVLRAPVAVYELMNRQVTRAGER